MTLRIRDITNEEGNKLSQTIRHAKDPIEVKRAQVILASAQGFTVQYISRFTQMTDDYIRTLIHQFERDRLAMLKPRWDPGNRRKFSEEARERIVALALSRPRDLGLPFGQWSLRRLRDEVVHQGIVPSISPEWLRVICDEADISQQSVRTWKVSKDPQLEVKKRRIDRLTRKKHNPPVVLSMDEIGPVSLRPYGGKGLFERRLPDTIPSTYVRTEGVRYQYLSLNVYHQTLSVRQMAHKGGAHWLRFLKYQRAKHPPRQRVYIIQDNLSAHWTPEIRAWAKAKKVTLVPTATNASWMNPCECHALHLQRTALAGSNYRNWDEVNTAFQRAARLIARENRASGKTFRDTQDGRRKHRRPLWKRH